jgi:hypothetical protein
LAGEGERRGLEKTQERGECRWERAGERPEREAQFFSPPESHVLCLAREHRGPWLTH